MGSVLHTILSVTLSDLLLSLLCALAYHLIGFSKSRFLLATHAYNEQYLLKSHYFNALQLLLVLRWLVHDDGANLGPLIAVTCVIKGLSFWGAVVFLHGNRSKKLLGRQRA